MKKGGTPRPFLTKKGVPRIKFQPSAAVGSYRLTTLVIFGKSDEKLRKMSQFSNIYSEKIQFSAKNPLKSGDTTLG